MQRTTLPILSSELGEFEFTNAILRQSLYKGPRPSRCSKTSRFVFERHRGGHRPLDAGFQCSLRPRKTKSAAFLTLRGLGPRDWMFCTSLPPLVFGADVFLHLRSQASECWAAACWAQNSLTRHFLAIIQKSDHRSHAPGHHRPLERHRKSTQIIQFQFADQR